LFCQECPRVSGEDARGWRLYRVDEPGEVDEPELAAYCASCAEREFGAVPRDARLDLGQ
jgi:hypothetical protein